MCSTVKIRSQWAHTGALPPSRIEPCVSRQWPTRNRVKTISILLSQWKEDCQKDNRGLMALNYFLLAMRGVDHYSCHLQRIYLWIGCFISEWGTAFTLISLWLHAVFAFLSALSFPGIHTWAGTQQKDRFMRTGDPKLTTLEPSEPKGGMSYSYSNSPRLLLEPEYITKDFWFVW